MEKRYELQSNALKNAWNIYHKNNGKVSWSQSCKFGWKLAKEGKLLKKEIVVKLTIDHVYATYRSQVYAFIFNIVKNKELAEDITSDTFVKVCEKLHTYDSQKSKLNTWLLTIAKNIIIDGSRSKAEKNNAKTDLVDGYTDENGDSIYEFNAHTLTPEDITENNELRKSIDIALSELNEKYRVAAIMGIVDGMEYKEISELLNIPINTVKTHIARAKAALQKSLKGVY